MLVEEGFSVTSVDASDKMLKYALKERWNRRHEPAFDKWGKWVGPKLSRIGSLLYPTSLSQKVFAFFKGMEKNVLDRVHEV